MERLKSIVRNVNWEAKVDQTFRGVGKKNIFSIVRTMSSQVPQIIRSSLLYSVHMPLQNLFITFWQCWPQFPNQQSNDISNKRKLDSTGQLLAHNSDTSSNAWQSQMHFTTIERIQKNCQNAMSKWGYKIFKYEDVHPNRAVLPLEMT